MAHSTNGDGRLEEADWISLMDYATRYGVSLSTLRRHIKANKIQFKVEHGRYLLRSPFAAGMVAPQTPSRPAQTGTAQGSASQSPKSEENSELQLSLQRAQEEIAELKMLIALYEEQLQPERPGQLRMNGH